MDEMLMNNILAVVEISSAMSLEETAARLETIIGGIKFEREETGRYEEVPAFVTEDVNSGTTFILFGIPEGEIRDAYILECLAETDFPIYEFREKTLEFISSILIEKEVNSRGYFDYSNELGNALKINGIMVLEPS
jgi:hypothetical protein